MNIIINLVIYRLSEVFVAVNVSDPSGRTLQAQAGYQAATLGVTLAMALVGGLVTGNSQVIPT